MRIVNLSVRLRRDIDMPKTVRGLSSKSQGPCCVLPGHVTRKEKIPREGDANHGERTEGQYRVGLKNGPQVW